MGNKGSEKSHGDIYLQTDHPFYFSGDRVTGKVYMNIKKSFPADKLFLKLKGCSFLQGKQKAWFKERVHRGENEYQDVHYKDEQNFFKQKVQLYRFEGSIISQGQYQFPFGFILRQNLPSSFEDNDHNYQASIKYKIKCQCQSTNKKGVKLKCTQKLVVRTPLKKYIKPLQGQQKISPSVWCCISKGQTFIKCYFQSNSSSSENTYLPGQQATIFCQIDNSKCQLDISKIKCVLMKSVTLKADGKKKVFSENANVAQFQGIGQGKEFTKQNARRYKLTLYNMKDREPILPSTDGKIVDCDYTLICRGQYDGCICCSQEPSIQAHILILSPPPINYGIVNAPPGWAPQQYQYRQINFNYNYPGGNNYYVVPYQQAYVPNYNPPNYQMQQPQQNMNPPPNQYYQPNPNMNEMNYNYPIGQNEIMIEQKSDL